eukprot:365243-Chlamydomonas_euryale.AAC.1
MLCLPPQVVVHNLPWSCTWQQLKDHFRVSIMRTRAQCGKKKGEGAWEAEQHLRSEEYTAEGLESGRGEIVLFVRWNEVEA